MGAREDFEAAARYAASVPESEEQRHAQHLMNKDEQSHMRFFQGRAPRAHIEDSTALAQAVGRAHVNHDPAVEEAVSRMRRQDARADHFAQVLQSPRVQGASGPDVLRVHFKEFQKMYADYLAERNDYEERRKQAAISGNPIPAFNPQFQPFSLYGPNLACYDNGIPRPKPLRPILENEVGMYKGKIVVLTDSGPDDLGEKYHQVPADAPIGEPEE